MHLNLEFFEKQKKFQALDWFYCRWELIKIIKLLDFNVQNGGFYGNKWKMENFVINFIVSYCSWKFEKSAKILCDSDEFWFQDHYGFMKHIVSGNIFGKINQKNKYSSQNSFFSKFQSMKLNKKNRQNVLFFIKYSWLKHFCCDTAAARQIVLPVLRPA